MIMSDDTRHCPKAVHWYKWLFTAFPKQNFWMIDEKKNQQVNG